MDKKFLDGLENVCNAMPSIYEVHVDLENLRTGNLYLNEYEFLRKYVKDNDLKPNEVLDKKLEDLVK